MVLLHGLFGMANNLGALARSLAPDFSVYSVDLPNHGRSDWVPVMGLADMAGHLADWLEAQGLASADFVGHSLGGKVAMELALLSPGKVNALVVADIAPVPYKPHHDSVFAALDAVAAAGCATRREAMAIMEGYLEEPGVAEFLLLSLTRDEEGSYRWRFNLEGLAGAPAEVVFVALTDALCPPGGTIDEALARHALLETIAALAAEGLGNFDELSQDDLREVFIGVVARSIEGKILNEVGTNAIKLAEDTAAVERAQRMLHTFVVGCVRDRFQAAGDTLSTLDTNQIDQYVTDLYAASFELMQTLGEAE